MPFLFMQYVEYLQNSYSLNVVDIFRLCQISEDSLQTPHDYFTDVCKMVVVVLLVCDISSQNVFCCSLQFDLVSTGSIMKARDFLSFLSDCFFPQYQQALL